MLESKFCEHMYIFKFLRSLVFIFPPCVFENQWNVDKSKACIKMERKVFGGKTGVLKTQLKKRFTKIISC